MSTSYLHRKKCRQIHHNQRDVTALKPQESYRVTGDWRYNIQDINGKHGCDILSII